MAEPVPSPFPRVLTSYSPRVVLSRVPAAAPFDYRAAAAALLGASAQAGTGLGVFIKNHSHRLIVIIILFNPAIVSLRPVKLRRDKLESVIAFTLACVSHMLGGARLLRALSQCAASLHS